MATLSGQHVRRTVGGLVSAQQLTANHYQFAWVNQSNPSPYANTAHTARIGLLQSLLPVVANPRTLPAQKSRAFIDDFYNRIHVSPSRLDLGNVASTQQSSVFIWNAYFEPRTLSSIDGVEDGIALTGQPAAPLLISALTELMWSVAVTPNGQPVLDASIIWDFDSEAPSLRITANRIISWMFAPDWADGVVERLTWATDILQSESGVEQRRALRLSPRREFEASMFVEGRERQMLDLALFGWSARIWALPIWHDIQLTKSSIAAGAAFIPCETQDLDFRVGGLAMLRGDSAFDSETVEIESITSSGLQLKRMMQRSWQAGTRLYPVRSAQLTQQPTLTRLSDMCSSVDVQFLITDTSDWPGVMPTALYRGLPVFDLPPDESEDLTSSYQRLLVTLDSGLALPLITDTADRAFSIQGYRWLEQGRAERASLRSFLYALNGRQKAIWIPTYADDLTMTGVMAEMGTTLQVLNVGYTRFAASKPGRRDIRIELLDGTLFNRRIIASTEEINGDIEHLALDSALGRQIQPADVRRISWLTLCRLDSDSVEIEHMTDSEGIGATQLVFRGVRDDEF